MSHSQKYSQSSSIFMGFSNINHPAIGVSPFMKTSISLTFTNCHEKLIKVAPSCHSLDDELHSKSTENHGFHQTLAPIATNFTQHRSGNTALRHGIDDQIEQRKKDHKRTCGSWLWVMLISPTLPATAGINWLGACWGPKLGGIPQRDHEIRCSMCRSWFFSTMILRQKDTQKRVS